MILTWPVDSRQPVITPFGPGMAACEAAVIPTPIDIEKSNAPTLSDAHLRNRIVMSIVLSFIYSWSICALNVLSASIIPCRVDNHGAIEWKGTVDSDEGNHVIGNVEVELPEWPL